MNENIVSMLKPHASYKDLIGNSELAWKEDEKAALNKLAEMAEINLAKYEPVAVGLFLAKSFHLSLYIADVKLIKGKKRIRRVSTEITLEEFRPMLQDLVIMLSPPHKKWDDYSYEGEVDFENL